MSSKFTSYASLAFSGHNMSRIANACGISTTGVTQSFYQCFSDLTPKKILLLGGTGNIGSALAQYFAQDIHNTVFATYRNTPIFVTPPSSLYANISTLFCDITNTDSISNTINSVNPDVVFVLAIDPTSDDTITQTVYQGALNVISVASATTSPKTLIYVSAIKSTNPYNTYSEAKANAETAWLNAAATYPNKTWSIMRLAAISNAPTDSFSCLLYNLAIRGTALPQMNPAYMDFAMRLEDVAALASGIVANPLNGVIYFQNYDSLMVTDIVSAFAQKYNVAISSEPVYDVYENPFIVTESESANLLDVGFGIAILPTTTGVQIAFKSVFNSAQTAAYYQKFIFGRQTVLNDVQLNNLISATARIQM